MRLFLLDTDILSLFRSRHPRVCERAAAHHRKELATSVITVEEQLSGWYSVLRQAKQDDQLVAAYQGLTRTVGFMARLQIISFSVEAAARFSAFRNARLKIKTMDLRIACIALEVGAKLVTRNRVDFEVVPGLELEDWTIP